MNKLESQEVHIAVDSWVIQDGNYGDFQLGDEIICAIEFADNKLRSSAHCRRNVVYVRENIYHVCAQVVYAGLDSWVIDFGISCFQNVPPPGFALSGSWVEGEIELAIDPFFYKEELCNVPGMPDLFNQWHIARIERNDTPWIASSCGKPFTRGQQHPRWTEVQLTDAWNDDKGRSTYLLHLVRRDSSPRR